MRRSLMLAALMLFASLLVEAQGVLTYNKPEHPTPPAGSQLKKTVAFIELQCRDGDKVITASGTAFLAGYSDPRLPKDSLFDYLVTNRHVALCWDENNRPLNVLSVRVRMNTKSGPSRTMDLSTNGNIRWYLPADGSVDLAVTPFATPQDLEAVVIPVDNLATKEFLSANNLAEGAQIILSGYFYQFPGERRIESIVRSGILSMMPDELMKTTTGRPGTVYLGDVHIFGGNSGSPVLVHSGDDLLHLGQYHFLGVVSGYYYEDQDFNLEIATTVKGRGRANSGVAMIVPADLLKALLDEPELKGMRDAYILQAPGAPKQ